MNANKIKSQKKNNKNIIFELKIYKHILTHANYFCTLQKK